MREIKFRAWDKVAKKFLHPWPDGFHILGETTCFDMIGMQLKERNPEKTVLEMLNDVEIMQFTGLKDKKGIEIYEGDIIELAENTYGETELPIRCVVKWNDKGFYQLWRNGLIHWKFWRKDTYHNTGYRKNWKVIGNIHQNPKLLEQK